MEVLVGDLHAAPTVITRHAHRNTIQPAFIFYRIWISLSINLS